MMHIQVSRQPIEIDAFCAPYIRWSCSRMQRE